MSLKLDSYSGVLIGAGFILGLLSSQLLQSKEAAFIKIKRNHFILRSDELVTMIDKAKINQVTRQRGKIVELHARSQQPKCLRTKNEVTVLQTQPQFIVMAAVDDMMAIGELLMSSKKAQVLLSITNLTADAQLRQCTREPVIEYGN